MPKMAPFNSKNENHYHDNSKCGPANEVPAHDRLPGTGGKPLCKNCAKLAAEGK